MQLPLQITYRGVDESEAVTEYVRTRAQKLETFFDRIMGCRVALEAPHRHRQQGRAYRVRVDVTVPGGELVVDRAPAEDRANQDLYAAIDEAFDNAVRVLRDHARKRRGDVKVHERAPGVEE